VAPGTAHRQAWAPALLAVRAVDRLCDEAFVSHASVVAFPLYGEAVAPVRALPRNLSNAIPGWHGARANDLAGRFAIGLEAAARVISSDSAPVRALGAVPSSSAIAARLVTMDVAMAGAGTGGVLAAVASGRAGASTCAIEPLPFTGGIGTGGGIHYYYFGVKGGMQEELDQRTRELMPLFGLATQIAGFHPDAKKLALDAMLSAAGVTLFDESTLVAVERVGRRVTSAIIATPRGPVRIQASAWIDGTGDGDVCARAGARSAFGRLGDGLPHAYSQSSGRARVRDGKVKMEVINYDAGWVDPCNDDDLTRARVEGISQYTLPLYRHRTSYLCRTCHRIASGASCGDRSHDYA